MSASVQWPCIQSTTRINNADDDGDDGNDDDDSKDEVQRCQHNLSGDYLS